MKKLLFWTIFSIIFAIFFPWIIAKLAMFTEREYFTILFFLWIVVFNMLFPVICGFIAGNNIKQLWALPIITVLLSWAGICLAFEYVIPFISNYAIIFLISIVAMFIGALVVKIKKT